LVLLTEKRQEFRSSEGCQVFSTLVEQLNHFTGDLQIFFCDKQMTNPAGQIAAQNPPPRELTPPLRFSNLTHGKEIR
jgi:hypothetical protein